MTFRYQKIGQPLIEELGEKVIVKRESVVLIAPRYGGKRYLMNRLYGLLCEHEQFHVLRPEVSLQTPVSNDHDFRDWLIKAVSNADSRFTEQDVSTDDPFAPLDWLVAHSQQPVVLLVSNIDSLSQLLARNLLLKIRTMVGDKKLVVVLSGEDVFQKLVSGPTSEFNTAHQYFLQGFDRERFEIETLKYRDALHLSFDSDEEVINLLYQRAGGQVSIMKTLLRSVIEIRLNSNRPLDSPISVLEIPLSINPDLLRQPTRVINNAPECWDDLKQLLRDDISWVSSVTSAPGPLELAGVAVRDGWRIRVASPLLKIFLKGYYDNKRFGDLYARNDKWGTAFACYEQLAEEERVRPSTADDSREATFTIKTLSAALLVAAAKGTSEVEKLFLKGCRYILGFREVAWLQLDGTWKLLAIPGFHLNEEAVKELNNILPGNEPKIGPFHITGHWGQYILAAIIPTSRSNIFRAIIVSDYATNRTILRERAMLTKQFLEHFVTAYQQAAKIEAAEQHLQARNRHIEIANSIFGGLGSSTRDVEHVIRSAAQSLSKLGYCRVSFCLVDPEKKRIKGVLDVSDDRSIDIASYTDWPLDNPTADIQPYVISTRKPKRVPDADREPLTNKELVKLARHKTFAIVPLLNQIEEAIGTVHVERRDGFVPTREEVEDLLEFGRQLAIAIAQSERVNLLQSTLDKIVSSLIIVDSTMKLRYANKKAAKLLGVEYGWQDQSQAKLFTKNDVGVEALDMIQESLQGQRQERHIKIYEGDDKHGWEALSDAVLDGRGQTVGAFLRIRDFAYLYRMFSVFNLITEAKDTVSALKLLLEATQRLGFEWGRLYLVDRGNPDCLVSKDYFGLLPDTLRKDFDKGKVRLERRNVPGKESWKCLDQGDPLVFYFAPDRKNGSKYITQKGQEAIVVTEPRLQMELHKKPGDFWVDIPLLTQDKRPLGKLTLEWSEKRWPREFYLLDVLAELASRVLEAFRLVRAEATHTVTATMAHNIGTQLAALPLLRRRYKLLEGELPKLQELNGRFGQITEDAMIIITRAKERLAFVSPQIEQLDLATRFESVLQSRLQPENWQVECIKRPFIVKADGHLLGMALSELVQNSKEAVTNEASLRIAITLGIEQDLKDERVKIVYQDNGLGVPEEFKERIFEDFFSRHPGNKSGTGLGMGYVRRVVEAHDGKIRECGKSGEGVEFIITLPFAKATKPIKEQNHVSNSAR